MPEALSSDDRDAVLMTWRRIVGEAGGAVRFETNEHLLPGLAEAFVPPDLMYSVTDRLGLPNGATMNARGDLSVAFHVSVLTDQYAYDSGDIAQSIDLHTGRARHVLYYLPSAAHGQNRGRLAIHRAVSLWGSLGVVSVETKAAQVGKYVWAMCGFDFAREQDRDLLHSGMASIAERVGIPFDLPRREHSWEYAYVGLDPDDGFPETISSTALALACDDRPPELEVWIPTGKALMLTAPIAHWNGRFDVRSGSLSRQVLAEYVGAVVV